MLWTVVVATLLVLCALGLVASATIGGLIHLLLVAAIVVALMGRRVLPS